MLFTFRSITSHVAKMTPKVAFVLGGPGAGKGTQCELIVKEFGFVHLSAGDLLREERARPDSEYGQLIETHIREGSIVPVEITCSLIERAMRESSTDKFLIDGFPRNKNNLDGWEKEVAKKVKLLFVLYFNCPLEICTQRCLSRGQAGSGRSDDNLESVKKRISTYLNETQPIIEYYREQNLVREIDATKSKDEVFGQVRRLFEDVAARGDY